MSGPIQSSIKTALKTLARAKTAAELRMKPNPDKTASDNALMLESRHQRIKEEVNLIVVCMNDLRTAQEEWADLLRKMNSVDRAEENSVYEDFQLKQKVFEKTDEATAKLLDLRDLEADLGIESKTYRSRADRDDRAEERRHAEALQKAREAQPAAQGGTSLIYQLPTIQLERFDGQRNRWPEFIESFRAAVDGKAGTKAEKLNLLRGLLEGEPRTLISGLRLEDRNYDVALRMLMDTYGAKEEHIRALHLELANLKPCNNVREAKELLLKLERIARELEYAGESIEGPQTFLMLERKLTPGLLRSILIKKREDPAGWTTSQFRKVLSDAIERETEIQEVMAEYGHKKFQRRNERPAHRNSPRIEPRGADRRESTFISSMTDEHQRTTQQVRADNNQTRVEKQAKPNKPARQRTSSQQGNGHLTRQAMTQKRQPPWGCIFCNAMHWNENCTKYTTAEQRIAALREKKTAA